MADDELKRGLDSDQPENCLRPAEMDPQISGTLKPLESQLPASADELKTDIAAVGKRVEGHLDDLALSVRLLDENLDRFRTSLGHHIDRSAAETQALIRSLVERSQ